MKSNYDIRKQKEQEAIFKNYDKFINSVLWLAKQGVLTNDELKSNYDLLAIDPQKSDTVACVLLNLHRAGLNVSNRDRECYSLICSNFSDIDSICRGLQYLDSSDKMYKNRHISDVENYLLVLRCGKYAEDVSSVLITVLRYKSYTPEEINQIRNILGQAYELADKIFDLIAHNTPIHSCEDLISIIRSIAPDFTFRFKEGIQIASSKTEAAFFNKHKLSPEQAEAKSSAHLPAPKATYLRDKCLC